MYFYEGYSCPICGQPFSENEDVVFCPQCGLPHHRACWMQEGHCHLAHLHNTEEQWSRDKAAKTVNQKQDNRASNHPHQICANCGTPNAEFAEFCQHCGAPLKIDEQWQSAVHTSSPYNEYQPFRSTQQPAQTSDNSEIDGVSSQDVSAFVGLKATYYVPRFQRMARNNSSASWNWAAFIFGPFWLLYRKMYAFGVLVMLLDIAQVTLTQFAFNAIGFTNNTTYAEIYSFVETAMTVPSNRYFLFAIFLLSVLEMAISIGVALFGNRLYRDHCKRKIQTAREHTPDLTSGELSTLGGTSIAVTIIGYFAQYFITQILLMFVL